MKAPMKMQVRLAFVALILALAAGAFALHRSNTKLESRMASATEVKP